MDKPVIRNFLMSKKRMKYGKSEIFGEKLCQVNYTQKNPHAQGHKNVYKHVDNVDN